MTVVRRWWPLAAMAALLVAAGLSAAHSTPRLDEIPRGVQTGDHPTLAPPEAESTPDSMERQAAERVSLPRWVPTLLSVLLLAFVVALVVIVVLSLAGRLRSLLGGSDREPPAGPPPAAPPDAAEVLAAVDAGLAGLADTDQDPRRAVIACWLRLEEAAEAAGVPRLPGDTPTDLVIRLLGGAAGEIGEDGGRVASADVLSGFAAVYRQARYATHTIDERMRDQARNSLRELRAELAAPEAR